LMAQIGEDAVRPLYEHLLALPEGDARPKRIDLFLYSRGGDVSVPWRIATMMREFTDDFCVLIPYKAYSAATMIALGADQIVMGKKAELGPIDPSLVRAPNPDTGAPAQISVEDVASYLSFVSDRAKITEQDATAQLLSQLATHITPLTLGTVHRQYSHIRLVARKLLTSHNEPFEEARVNALIETLTESLYSHGHAIGRTEAAQHGLNVERADPDLERAMWDLFVEYENWMEMTDPLDPDTVLDQQQAEQYTMTGLAEAAVESVARVDVFESSLSFRRIRQIPPNPQININLQLGLPANMNPNELAPEAQQILQELAGQVTEHVRQQVQQEITRQSPVRGIEMRTFGGKWYDRTRQQAKQSTSRSQE